MRREPIHKSLVVARPNFLGVPVLIFGAVLMPVVLVAVGFYFFQYWPGVISTGVFGAATVAITVWLHGGDPDRIFSWVHAREISVELEANSNLRSKLTTHQ